MHLLAELLGRPLREGAILLHETEDFAISIATGTTVDGLGLEEAPLGFAVKPRSTQDISVVAELFAPSAAGVKVITAICELKVPCRPCGLFQLLASIFGMQLPSLEHGCHGYVDATSGLIVAGVEPNLIVKVEKPELGDEWSYSVREASDAEGKAASFLQILARGLEVAAVVSRGHARRRQRPPLLCTMLGRLPPHWPDLRLEGSPVLSHKKICPLGATQGVICGASRSARRRTVR